MNQYGLLILAGKLSCFPQLPELSSQRVIQRLMSPGQRVLVFIATDHEHVRGFLGKMTFLDLTLHAILLSLGTLSLRVPREQSWRLFSTSC